MGSVSIFVNALSPFIPCFKERKILYIKKYQRTLKIIARMQSSQKCPKNGPILTPKIYLISPQTHTSSNLLQLYPMTRPLRSLTRVPNLVPIGLQTQISIGYIFSAYSFIYIDTYIRLTQTRQHQFKVFKINYEKLHINQNVIQLMNSVYILANNQPINELHLNL